MNLNVNTEVTTSSARQNTRVETTSVIILLEGKYFSLSTNLHFYKDARLQIKTKYIIPPPCLLPE